MENLICKYPGGCEVPAPTSRIVGGWCWTHYQRIYKSTTDDPGPAGALEPKCSKCIHPEGCEEPGPYTRGWCRRHYIRIDRSETEDPGPLDRKIIKSGSITVCTVRECGEPHGSFTFCQSHSNRHKAYGLDAEELYLVDTIANCMICKIKMTRGRGGHSKCVDHNKALTKGDPDFVRGVLCSACNVGIGCFDHDLGIISRARAYLLNPLTIPEGAITFAVGEKNQAECRSCRERRHKEYNPFPKERRKWDINGTLDYILYTQNYQCPITLKPAYRNSSLDHDHETKLIRGLIDGKVNMGLGLFKDNITSLDSAMRYLQDPPGLTG